MAEFKCSDCGKVMPFSEWAIRREATGEYLLVCDGCFMAVMMEANRRSEEDLIIESGDTAIESLRKIINREPL